MGVYWYDFIIHVCMYICVNVYLLRYVYIYIILSDVYIAKFISYLYLPIMIIDIMF